MFHSRNMPLQRCDGFCCTATGISCNRVCTYPSQASPSPHPPAPIPPSRSSEHQAGLPVLHSSFPLVICFAHGSMCVSILLSRFQLCVLFHCPHLTDHAYGIASLPAVPGALPFFEVGRDITVPLTERVLFPPRTLSSQTTDCMTAL